MEVNTKRGKDLVFFSGWGILFTGAPRAGRLPLQRQYYSERNSARSMTDSPFTVLDGGQLIDIPQADKHFISAYVTDTRLMGVMVVYAHWHVDTASSGGPLVWGDLHQFFYIDCEETGLETYVEIRVDDPARVAETEQAMIGGLGASKVDLTEKQLRRIMCFYRQFNREHGLPLPEGLRDYSFLFTPDETPDSRQQALLMKHICSGITTDVQLINYFLMRCFGRDHRGAAYLAAKGGQAPKAGRLKRRTDGPSAGDSAGAEHAPAVDVGLYDRYERATFCRNVIDKRSESPDGTAEYLCESLIEMDGRYDMVITRLTVKDLAVTGAEECSCFPVSDAEAALMLKKSEFVTLYEIFLSEEELEANMDEFSVGFHATMSPCENGRLFMAFRPNNDHVNRREFQLNNDVRGIFFLSDHGQLITAAYSLEDIRRLERTVKRSVLAPYLVPSAKYEFKEPVLYEFMHSDIDYFETFLALLQGGE